MSTENLYAQAAQAAFANQPPTSQVDQDLLLATKIQQNATSNTENVASGESTTASASVENSNVSSSSNASNDGSNAEQAQASASKSFEDYLAEKSGGKIKSWEEVESYLNAPQTQASSYKSELAEKVDSYIASGGKIDDNWFKIQTTDYSTYENPIDLFREQMKIKSPELSDVEIEYELNERYKLDQWEDDDDSPLQQAMSAKIAREAKEALNFLTDNQKKLSIFSDGKTPEQVEAEKQAYAQMEESAKQAKSKFSDDVRAAVSEIEKLKFSPIDGFEVDYTLSNDEKEVVSKVVSSLYDGSTGLLEPYLKKNGDQITGVDIKGLATKLAKAEIFDSVIKKIAQESKAAGAANIVKNQKNINFSAESKSTNDTKPVDVNSVLAAHFASKI